MWRPLAEVNKIDDPIRLPVGATLMVPAAHELAAGG
jgi:nucleoid-associated protein YgaU